MDLRSEDHPQVAVAFGLLGFGAAAAALYVLTALPAPIAYYVAILGFSGIIEACLAVAWASSKGQRSPLRRAILAVPALAGLVMGALWILTHSGFDERRRIEISRKAETTKLAEGELAKLEARKANMVDARRHRRRLEEAVRMAAENRLAACQQSSPRCSALSADVERLSAELASATARAVPSDEESQIDEAEATLRQTLSSLDQRPASAYVELTGQPMSANATACILVIAAALLAGGIVAVVLAYAGNKGNPAHAPLPSRRPWFSAIIDGGISMTQPRIDERLVEADLVDECLRALFPKGNVNDFAEECLKPAASKATWLSDIFERYRGWCGSQQPSRPAVSVEEFGTIFKAICEARGARIGKAGDRYYAKGLEIVT